MAVEFGTPQFFLTFTGEAALMHCRALEHNLRRSVLQQGTNASTTPCNVLCAANELGWSDMRAGCDGLHHTQCPVEATRIYNHRWKSFLDTYLKGSSPLGNITRVWWRQEDQVRRMHFMFMLLTHKSQLCRSSTKHCTAIAGFSSLFWQARGSLHVHAAIWVDPATIKEDAIIGTAPRADACSTRAQRAFRKFVLKVCF